MPRKRSPENVGLPKRWRHTRGAYYYQVPPGQEEHWDGKQTFKLGTNLADAHDVYSQRIRVIGEVDVKRRTCGQLFDRYLLEVVPKKAKRSQANNQRHIVNLRKVFDKTPIESFTPQFVYRYVDARIAAVEARAKKECEEKGQPYEHRYRGKVEAHKEVKTLSHVFTWAVRWGDLKKHPFKGEVRFEGEEADKARTRYVEDWELEEALSLEPTRKAGSILAIRAYICIKLMIAIRRADLLRLRPAYDFDDAGIHVRARKTAKTTGQAHFFPWTPELRQAVDMALDARPVDIGPYLFCNRRGEPYVNEKGNAYGWDSMWNRFMARVLKETNVKERFTEHDLRAKPSSDAESLELAQKLLGHADPRMTKKAYRRKADVVQPAKPGRWWKA